MNRALLKHALAISAASLLATSAYAQSPNANPQGKGHAAEPAKAAAAAGAAAPKADDKANKGKDGDKKPEDKAKDGDKGKEGAAGDLGARKAKQHEEQKAKLRGMLKGPMDEALKQELRRHAERLARIERIKTLADGAKDTDAADRAAKLTAKENARHDKWMEKHVASPTGAAVPAPAAQPDSKGGDK